MCLKKQARDYFEQQQQLAVAQGKVHDEKIILSHTDAISLKISHSTTMKEHAQQKLRQIKQVSSLYVPKTFTELNKKSNESVSQKYQGVVIDLADGKSEKFLQKKTAREIRRIKED